MNFLTLGKTSARPASGHQKLFAPTVAAVRRAPRSGAQLKNARTASTMDVPEPSNTANSMSNNGTFCVLTVEQTSQMIFLGTKHLDLHLRKTIP